MMWLVATETRPLRADAERNRRRLLDAAAEVFAEHGLDASVAEIARRAGVGQGTVFRRFPSKDHLIAAIIADRIDQIAAEARALLDRAPAEGWVLAFMAAFVQQQLRDRALVEAVGGDSAYAADAVRRGVDALLDLIEELLRRDREAGLVRADLSALDILMLSKAVASACEPLLTSSSWKRYLAVVAAGLRPAEEKLPGRPPSRARLERALAEKIGSQS
jgi:AcrR family transcriptional regulator